MVRKSLTTYRAWFSNLRGFPGSHRPPACFLRPGRCPMTTRKITLLPAAGEEPRDVVVDERESFPSDTVLSAWHGGYRRDLD
jgi:hypothetical protein